MKKITLLILLFLPLFTLAQNSKFKARKITKKIKAHITYLASDELEGRNTGTKGETLAAEYIIKEFEKLGLSPKGENGSFYQKFEFSLKPEFGESNILNINGINLKFKSDFYPLAMSGNGELKGTIANLGYGIVAPKLNHNDYENTEGLSENIFLIQLSNPEGTHPHSKFLEVQSIETKIENAIKNGAKAILFYNKDENYEVPEMKLHRKIRAENIPILFITADGMEKVNLNQDFLRATIQSDIIRKKAIGKNVMGYFDNKAKNTVVIGAHYDHLGLGNDGNSLHIGGNEIHNGADDNASGTAALIELAAYLKKSKAKQNNYLFIAFSGEELGLLGSNYFVNHPTISIENMNYMLNMDMIGRLNPDDKALGINGVGTSPSWKTVIDSVGMGMRIKTTESGIGSSDHTSFYLKEVPAIHFFSGAHEDYHKPSDDVEKINYKGEIRIIRYMISIIENLDDDGKIPFTKTKEETRATPSFKVTLGIMPSYMYEGKGMKVDAVRENRPGANAGLKDGDVIISIGEIAVTDIMSYMKGLNQFKKGDATKVKVLREGKEIILDVVFD